MDKPLLDLLWFDGLGLIIEHPSGVRYTNQTGGYACHHPEVEGAFIPIPDHRSEQAYVLKKFFTGPKCKGWCYDGIDEETARFVDKVLGQSRHTQSLQVNRAKLAESQEAWIHVTVRSDQEPSELWSGFENAVGIITWENSD
jgi:hypothetical protein